MHTKENIAIGVVMVLLFLLMLPSVNAVIADQKFQISGENPKNQVYFNVDYPKHEYYKLHENITFNVHVFDAVMAIPVSNVTAVAYNITCIIHHYNSTGDKIIEDILLYDGDYDFYEKINDTRIVDVEGRHTYRIWCGYYNWTLNDEQEYIMTPFGGGWVSTFFDINLSGKAPAGDNVIIFFMLAFIASIIAMIYLLIYTLQKYATLDVDYIDFGKNLVAYCAFLIIYGFNNLYLGNIMIESVLRIFIVAGVFINILIPGILLYSCYLIHVIKSQGGGNI